MSSMLHLFKRTDKISNGHKKYREQNYCLSDHLSESYYAIFD